MGTNGVFYLGNNVLHGRETSILERIERSCRTMRPLQNGGREAGMAGKQRIGFTFSCTPALVRLFIAPLEQESFCKWAIIRSDLCRARKLIKFKSLATCLPLSCSRFVGGFQAQIPKVFCRTVTANKPRGNVKFTTKCSW